MTTTAKSGDVVTAVFTTSEALTANPTVTLGGQAMTFSTLVGSTYTYTRNLTGAETDGPADLLVTGTDLATPANTTTASNIGTFTTDFTAPALTLPANITGQEATSSAGRVVTFTATSTDISPATPTVNCTPASGSTFALGTTTVNCSAADTAGNTSNGSFTITVVDTTKPVITLNGSNPTVIQVLTGTYSEAGANATDNYYT